MSQGIYLFHWAHYYFYVPELIFSLALAGITSFTCVFVIANSWNQSFHSHHDDGRVKQRCGAPTRFNILKMVLCKLKIFEDHRTFVDYYPYCSLVLLSVHMRLIPYICLTNSYNNLINTAMPPFFFLFIVSFISCFIYQRVRNVIFQNISPPSPVFKISHFMGWIKSPIGDFTHKRFESEWVGIRKKALSDASLLLLQFVPALHTFHTCSFVKDFSSCIHFYIFWTKLWHFW